MPCLLRNETVTGLLNEQHCMLAGVTKLYETGPEASGAAQAGVAGSGYRMPLRFR